MGRDITLYPKKASKNELSDYLKSLGFMKCEHLWDWPKGTLNYSWFDQEDFKSTDGVSADVYPVSREELKYTGNPWALHVRNLYSASWYDVKKLNDVLRGARKEFGGIIKGDYGTNKYPPLWEDKSTPMSRGLTGLYVHVEQQISKVKVALPNPIIKTPTNHGKSNGNLTEFINNQDPSRILYNGLVPFAVAIFEFFFSQAFQVLIAYDEFALKKRNSHHMKVDFSRVLELDNKEQSIEGIIASDYTFQNLEQLNKAYKEWLNIDVRKILFKKKKIGSSIRFLENRIAEIIQYRHGIVHHLSIDTTLTKEGYEHILNAIKISIDEFINFIENKYSIKIERI